MPLWPPGHQSQGLCSGCPLSAVAAGRKAEVWVCPSSTWGSPSGRSACPLPWSHGHRNFLQNPQMCLKEELATKALSKCSKGCGWRGKTLLFRSCFHFITQLLNLLLLSILEFESKPQLSALFPMFSVWKQENYLTKIHLYCEFDLEYVILHEAIMQLGRHERMLHSPLEQMWGITDPALP